MEAWEPPGYGLLERWSWFQPAALNCAVTCKGREKGFVKIKGKVEQEPVGLDYVASFEVACCSLEQTSLKPSEDASGIGSLVQWLSLSLCDHLWVSSSEAATAFLLHEHTPNLIKQSIEEERFHHLCNIWKSQILQVIFLFPELRMAKSYYALIK